MSSRRQPRPRRMPRGVAASLAAPAVAVALFAGIAALAAVGAATPELRAPEAGAARAGGEVDSAPAGADSSSATRAAPGPLAGLHVSLDPGHNPGNVNHPSRINRIVQAGPIRKACDTTGTATDDGRPEARFTLDLARRVARRLRAQGARVTLVHDGARSWGPCITERARIGNRADVAVSLHADGNTGRGARGFHVIRPGFVRGYTGDITVPSARLARHMRDQLVRVWRLPTSTYAGRDGIDVRRDLGGLVLSDVPKVFVEAGNMRHARDARAMRSVRGRERLAAAVTMGVVRWHLAERPRDVG